MKRLVFELMIAQHLWRIYTIYLRLWFYSIISQPAKNSNHPLHALFLISKIEVETQQCCSHRPYPCPSYCLGFFCGTFPCCLFIYLSIYLFIYLFNYLLINLLINLFIYSFNYLFIYLSIYLFIYIFWLFSFHTVNPMLRAR